MLWFHHPAYVYGRHMPGLPRQIHGFVRDRAARIHQALRQAGIRDFVAPPPLDETWLMGVHTPEVVADLHLPQRIAAAVELDWLARLPTFLARRLVVLPQLRATSGTVMALAAAADGQWTFNLSGGFHHARPDKSHGFCLVNDVAVAVERLRGSDSAGAEARPLGGPVPAESRRAPGAVAQQSDRTTLRSAGRPPPILVLDLDVHQGDGNAAAFAGDPEVFTVSMHEEALFPFPKLHSDIDVGLASGIGDSVYLRHLDRLLASLPERFQPAVVIYVAGTDPLESDRLSHLFLSPEGIIERDRRVARYVRAQGAGLVVLPAGGYSPESPQVAAAGMLAIAAEAPPGA